MKKTNVNEEGECGWRKMNVNEGHEDISVDEWDKGKSVDERDQCWRKRWVWVNEMGVHEEDECEEIYIEREKWKFKWGYLSSLNLYLWIKD